MSSFLDFCQHLPEVSFDAGDYLIRENEKEDRLFFLKSGSVEILKKDSVINSVVAAGSVIGEVSALLGRSPLASVRASTDCVLYVTDRPQEFLDETPQIAIKIARTLAARLYSVTNHLAEIATQNRSDQYTLKMISGVTKSLYNQQAQDSQAS